MSDRILRIDPNSGAAGDMFLGAFLELGVPLEWLSAQLEGLALPGWELSAEPTRRAGLAATKAKVKLALLGGEEEGHAHPPKGDHGAHHHPQEIIDRIEAAPLPESAKKIALRAFQLLAEAEARVHGTTVESVHFHEVGATDALIDICGSALAYHYLESPRVFSAPVAIGEGSFRCAHGELPLPGPATLALLEGFPLRPSGIARELVTPTGAAILRALDPSFDPAPPHRHLRSGLGAGSDDRPGRPNVLRLSLGELLTDGEEAIVDEVAFEVDDMSAEALAALRDRLPPESCLDVSFFPCTMKKGRPGTAVRILLRAGSADDLASSIFTHTSTFGFRVSRPRRIVLERDSVVVETSFGLCPVKRGRYRGRILQLHPEAEVVAGLAREAGVGFQEVEEAARQAARQSP